jgi:hypothetical protein
MKSIVTFEMEETVTDSIFKLSHDRDVKSNNSIIEHLKNKSETG